MPTEEFVHILSNCIKEITNQIRMIPPTQPTPHVIMMRSLLEMAIPLRINPTYANVITLLQKVNYYINQHVLLSLVMSMPIFVIS